MAAAALVTVGALGTIGAIASSMGVTRVLSEREIAHRAAAAKIAEIVGCDITKIVSSYDADPTNDPYGIGTAPGATFNVAGLTPPKGVDKCGSVVFPSTAVGATFSLRENVTIPELGMPGDLNGDGVIDGNDHNADYKLVPVKVLVRWKGAAGTESVSQSTLLCAK